jgi:hypothetical protein
MSPPGIVLGVNNTRDSEQPDDLSEAMDESRDVPIFVGEASDYSEAFLAALEQYHAGDLDSALAAFEALLAEHDDPVADEDVYQSRQPRSTARRSSASRETARLRSLPTTRPFNGLATIRD